MEGKVIVNNQEKEYIKICSNNALALSLSLCCCTTTAGCAGVVACCCGPQPASKAALMATGKAKRRKDLGFISVSFFIVVMRVIDFTSLPANKQANYRMLAVTRPSAGCTGLDKQGQ